MVRKILSAITVSIFVIGLTVFASTDAFAGGRGHGGYYHSNRGGLSAGEILGVGAGLMILDHMLNANRPRVVVAPTYGYGYPQPPVIIIVPQSGYDDYRAGAIRDAADWRAEQENARICANLGWNSPYCNR